ncbi:bifunctional diguanylate cyclase/phosphodiesterase [Paenibacillus thiaminolyticus]|uniref:putative bifunctional diguanylate cyclase/phosphodiesterase n=1 Tax=Paenibacillus thiaminolyticus TaxID=49283 RepID=UPI003D282FD3
MNNQIEEPRVEPRRTSLFVVTSLLAAITCIGGAVVFFLSEGFLRIGIGFLGGAAVAYIALSEWRAKPLRRETICQTRCILDNRAPAGSEWAYLVNHVPVPIFFIERDGAVKGVNHSFRGVTGYEEELPALSKVMDECSKRKLLDSLTDLGPGNEKELALAGFHKEGFRQDWIARVVRLADGICPQAAQPIYSVSLQDPSPDRHMAERIRYMSYYDDMTGLPNRRMFMQRLEEAIGMAVNERFSIAVLYMDLDRFKRINDTFGTDFGDMLLMQIAERLLRTMTDNDVVARMEGDEFACFFTFVESEAEVHKRIVQWLSVLEEPFYLNDVPVHVTMSIGIAMVENPGAMNGAQAMKHADLALSRVKEQGKNGFLFYVPEMNDRPLERLTLENDMRRGLKKEEFELYYQPQYDMNTERIVGMEALVRWNHPVRGMISPGEFIPIAEENGFIVALGTWVLEEACRQNKEWQQKGYPPIPVSVNLSVRQFEMDNLSETVQEVLAKTGLNPAYLDLEITESMTMDVPRASPVLQQLKDMGVAISIDDFGTGYSSLHYLKNFPIHRLKIDRSFVRDLQQDPNDAAIVSAIIALGHNMNMQVIAEGVETEEQLLFLQKHNCDEIQGFYFSPPLSCQRFEQLFREQCETCLL